MGTLYFRRSAAVMAAGPSRLRRMPADNARQRTIKAATTIKGRAMALPEAKIISRRCGTRV
jgi:hypothetical protein